MKRHTRISIWISLASGMLVCAVYTGGLFRGVENFLEDRLFSPKPIDSRTVILAIDNDSLSRVGQWPWPRKVFAEAITSLAVHPPAALGIDVVWSEASRYGADDDKALAAALQAAQYPVALALEASPIVVNASGYSAPAFVRPLPEFTGEAVSIGHVNLPLDQDNIARSIPREIVGTVGGASSYKALAYETVARSGIPVAPRPVAIRERIVYAGASGSVRRIPFSRISEPEIQKELEGKIVFLGATAADLHDDQVTPYSRGVSMPGVEIQAQAANMLISGYFLAPLSPLMAYFWIILSIAVVLGGFVRFQGSTRPMVVAFSVGVVNLLSAVVFFGRGTILPVIVLQLAWIVPSAALFAYRYFAVDREKRELRNVFSKYVSADVLSDMLADPSKVRLGGEEKEATIFFSDVRGFTTLSEKMTPTQLTHFLNKYLTVMTDITLERRGVVDKYIGDAIMAFWGAPLVNARHAMDAVETSLQMTTALAQFNQQSVAEGDPAIDIGIGLNSGRVTAGNMGSERRFDYTVMGDTVNLASRLESLTKQYGVHIIISEYTYARLDGAELKEKGILTREIDRVKVKGKKLPVTLFEVVDPDKCDKVAAIADEFSKGRAAYYAGNWPLGLSIFKKLSESNPWDGPTKTLLERCEYFVEHPPEIWDGSYEMKSK